MIEADGMSAGRADEQVLGELDIVILKATRCKQMITEGQDDWYPKLEMKQAIEFLQNALQIMDGKR